MSKKVLFCNLPCHFKISGASRWPEKTKSQTLYYPYWLAYAVGVAEKSGFDVHFIDAIAKGWDESKTIKTILDLQPDLVVGESTTPTINFNLNFIKRCKQQGYKGKFCLTGTHISVS